jgi:hypothetical protein
VTLDQLVHGEDAPETESAPASSAPQAAPKREKRHTIAGTALLCTGAVILVLWLLLTGDLLTGLMFASPFLICGIIFLAVKRHTGLYCGWAVYLCVDLYLRCATGLSWMAIFVTRFWTAELNYVRLAIAWAQFLVMVLMIVCTMRSYRTLRLPATKKEVTWLIAGWLAALVVLPLLMSCGIMPLWRDNLHNHSDFSLHSFLSVLYSYGRLTLVNVLLVRTFAVWRVKREGKKANRNGAKI